MTNDKRLFLLDGHALVYRAHYAFISRPLINSKGWDTSAITGFVRTLTDLINNQKPTHLAVSFDLPGGTFRDDMYPAGLLCRCQPVEIQRRHYSIGHNHCAFLRQVRQQQIRLA